MERKKNREIERERDTKGERKREYECVVMCLRESLEIFI